MVRSFGQPTKRTLREQAEHQAEKLWEIIEADFATLKRECKIDHPCKMQTLERIREELAELETIYRALANTAE